MQFFRFGRLVGFIATVGEIAVAENGSGGSHTFKATDGRRGL